MGLMMRLRQQGRKNKRVFRCVVMDKRAPRDGKYVEKVGSYDPHREGHTIINKERVEYWFKQGARPTEKMKSILKNNYPESLHLIKKVGKQKKQPKT